MFRVAKSMQLWLLADCDKSIPHVLIFALDNGIKDFCCALDDSLDLSNPLRLQTGNRVHKRVVLSSPGELDGFHDCVSNRSDSRDTTSDINASTVLNETARLEPLVREITVNTQLLTGNHRPDGSKTTL